MEYWIKPKMSFRSIFNKILIPLCGEYTGVQVFLAPITLFYLIETDSLLSAATSLLSFRIHYFPLLVFAVIFAFVLFMMLKIKLMHADTTAEFIERIIELNISVMAVVIIALIIYAVSDFLSYFYGIRGTIKSSMYMLFKLYTSLIIIHQFLFSVLLAPYFKRSYGRNRAIWAFKAWSRKNKLLLFRYGLIWVLIIIAATRFYQLLINLVFDPAINIVNNLWGFDLRLRLYPFVHVDDIFLNILICLFAFAISNLLFYPIVFVFNWLAYKLIPSERIMSNRNAQTTP